MTNVSFTLDRFQQGAHVAVMFLVLVGAFFILPRDGSVAPILVNMAYILSFGLSFGVQFWMTFVNGNL